jgi:hypothetical protein
MDLKSLKCYKMLKKTFIFFIFSNEFLSKGITHKGSAARLVSRLINPLELLPVIPLYHGHIFCLILDQSQKLGVRFEYAKSQSFEDVNLTLSPEIGTRLVKIALKTKSCLSVASSFYSHLNFINRSS